MADREKDSALMGWLVLLALFALSLSVLWRLGVRQGMLTAAAAALMLGASGYALQGRPGLRGAPASGNAERESRSLTDARHAFFGNFSPEESWLLMSEALARAGNTEDSVGILQNAVRRYPTDPQLWIGLGNALVEHAHGLTPPAELAYRKAAELAPGHPAPRFFYDLALVRSGGGDAALKDLVALMRENPGASWRPMVGTLVLAVALNAERPRSAAR
jgi:cytochrome c-type biogenesis protein CcmH